MMKLIDTHCHLYGKEFARDGEEVIQRAEREGVEKFYLPAVDSESREALLALEARYPGVCIGMTGLHPTSVKADFEAELRMVEEDLGRRSWVAVGEIGLDFYWDRTFEVEQYEAFHRQIGWAMEYDIPIVIHSRSSMAESIGVVRERQQGRGGGAARPVGASGAGRGVEGFDGGEGGTTPGGGGGAAGGSAGRGGERLRGNGRLRGIFHCFSGDAAAAREIVDLGFYLGIGGVLTYKNSGLPDAIKDIGLEHIVLETDAPYLSPVPFRGKRNESSYLKYVAAKLAELKGVSMEEVGRITTENAQKIFGG